MGTETKPAYFVGAISTRASDNPENGHYFWTYRAIHQKQSQGGLDVATVIGPIQTEIDFIVPFFRGKITHTEFNVGITLPIKYRLHTLEGLLRERLPRGVKCYFCYDGGLSDFLVMYWLAYKLPDLDFVFNFHWADQWLALIQSTQLSSLLGRKALKWMIHRAPPNLRLSAETKVFGQYLQNSLNRPFEIFPVFSNSEPRTIPPWSDREIDILFLPQRKSEMLFVYDAAIALKAQGHTVAIAVKRETWDRWTQSIVGDLALKPILLPVSAEDYESMLSASRIVVLPYDKPYFRWGSSGKFNEAIAHGCFPLVPSGLAISSQSSGPSLAHEFELGNHDSLMTVVRQNLSSESPHPVLRPTTLEDFFEWIGRKDSSSKPGLGRLSGFRMSWLIFSASTYRDRDATAFSSLKKIWHFLRGLNRVSPRRRKL